MEFNAVMFEKYASSFVLVTSKTKMRDGRSALPYVLGDFRPFVSAPDGKYGGNPWRALNTGQERRETVQPDVAASDLVHRVDHQ